MGSSGTWFWLPFDWTPEAWHGDSLKWSTFWRPFIRDMAFRILGEVPYYYQAEPNLRIQEPGREVVDWHSDTDFGHLPEEVNIWVPLVWLNSDSQRLWLEVPQEDAPIWERTCPPVQLGEALVFKGSTRHASRPNRTNITRYSFDFRLIRQADYRDTGAKSVIHNVPLSLGHYWKAP